jgi:ABC-type sulfate/molybdate transport systems ATPase subunit/ABC-type sulfate transport system permease component
MTHRRAPRPLYWLGALLVLYLAYPVAAFIVRVVSGHNAGWSDAGLVSALRVSVEGATISVLIGVLIGIPLAYVLARRPGWLASAVGVIVQLPLAVPPLISGILLIYVVGPYTFLGRLSGQRLTETMIGVVIAQSFVSLPFLVVVARAAFRAVDPSLGDVAATLGHGPVARFLRVDVPAASDGLRTGMVLMWLRAFGEYGTTVVLAYHPYSLPVYVDNLFSSAPLSQAEAPTILAFAVAALAILAGSVRPRKRALRSRRMPAPLAPARTPPTPVGFDLDVTLGSFRLAVAHPPHSPRLAIVGPSGSGKSVTLRALAGLLGPGAGTVTYGGVQVSAIAAQRRRVGYVPQGFGLMPGRTVWQQALFGVHADPARAAWWLQTLQIASLSDRFPDQLSGGQRQRAGLARALAGDPEVVLLDEPFSALDAPVRAELRRELRRLQREVDLSTVLVTHDPEEAAMLADEIIVMSDGQVLQSGSCRDVYQRPGSVEIGALLGIDNLFDTGVPGAIRTNLAEGTSLLWQVPPEAIGLRPAPSASHPSASHPSASHPSASHASASTLELGGGRVIDIIDLGRSVEILVSLEDGSEIRARNPHLPDLRVGAACRVHTDADAVSVWSQTASPAAARTDA